MVHNAEEQTTMTDRNMSLMGRKGKVVRIVKEGRARGETYEQIFSKYPQYSDLREYAIEIYEARYAGKNGNGKIVQKELPIENGQTRLRPSNDSHIYEFKGDDTKPRIKVQIYDQITDSDTEIAFLRAVNTGLDAENVRLRAELESVKRIIDALKALGFNPEGMAK
jgi:hypothetical protein